jgi:hypothetical protein
MCLTRDTISFWLQQDTDNFVAVLTTLMMGLEATKSCDRDALLL